MLTVEALLLPLPVLELRHCTARMTRLWSELEGLPLSRRPRGDADVCAYSLQAI